MGEVIAFPRSTTDMPSRGLTRQECADIRAVASRLIEQGRATGVSIHNDAQYMGVFDRNGEPYLISRRNGVCYLSDKHEMIFARSQRFEIVLDALEMLLSPSPDEAD